MPNVYAADLDHITAQDIKEWGRRCGAFPTYTVDAFCLTDMLSATIVVVDVLDKENMTAERYANLRCAIYSV